MFFNNVQSKVGKFLIFDYQAATIFLNWYVKIGQWNRRVKWELLHVSVIRNLNILNIFYKLKNNQLQHNKWIVSKGRRV